jgi:hypothetical protein
VPSYLLAFKRSSSNENVRKKNIFLYERCIFRPFMDFQLHALGLLALPFITRTSIPRKV